MWKWPYNKTSWSIFPNDLVMTESNFTLPHDIFITSFNINVLFLLHDTH